MTHPHLEGLIRKYRQKAHEARFSDRGTDLLLSEVADELESALAALPGGGDWQPIETAPYADFEGTHPITCLVYSKRFGVQMGRAWRYTDGEACGQAIGFNGNWEVTHWMPLPSSPTPTPHEADRNG